MVSAACNKGELELLRISAPMVVWRLIFWSSVSVYCPCWSSKTSGRPTLPISCNWQAAEMSCTSLWVSPIPRPSTCVNPLMRSRWLRLLPSRNSAIYARRQTASNNSLWLSNEYMLPSFHKYNVTEQTAIRLIMAGLTQIVYPYFTTVLTFESLIILLFSYHYCQCDY